MQGYSLDAHKSAFFLELSKAATVFRGDDSSCSGRLAGFRCGGGDRPCLPASCLSFQMSIFHAIIF